MNKYITHLLAFAAGAGIAVLATNNYYKKFYGDRADQEVLDMQEAYERKLAEIEGETIVLPSDPNDELLEETVNNPYGILARSSEAVNVKPKLYDMAAKYDSQELEEHLEGMEHPEEDEDEEDFEWEDMFQEVDQEAYFAFAGPAEDLKYYVHDDILTDSDGQIIPDATVVVGEEGLTLFDHAKDVVYIWNHDIDTIFKITRVYGRWLTE